MGSIIMDVTSKPLPIPPSNFIEKQASTANSRVQYQKTNEMAIETNRRQPSPSNASNDSDDEEDFEFFHEFEREKVKVTIHFITAELKERGIAVEYVMIPFRPHQTNEKLLKFLNAIFPMGNGQAVSENLQVKIMAKTEPLTLFQALKYIWCRLPDQEVIGWKSYLEFKIREQAKDYPKKAFLEIMPQCLSSASHASIVYDFFDLIITMASNSKKNKMSARKISKMCAVWAFGKPVKNSGMLDYDFTDASPYPNNSFCDGLNQWIPGTDAIFHLLLAFLKSFVPQDLESAQLPIALKSLLFNNDYPPKQSTAYSSETILTIPLVTLRTDRFSRKPWEMLERCNEKLDFTNHEAFEAREDYALLKSLFKKKNNVEGISRKMSQESKRLMKSMATKHSTFQAGWAVRKCLPNASHLEEEVEVKRVEIDDYFIWAWLSTLSYEQTSEKKKLFGRSLILEFEFDGFKKWVLFEECDITIESKKMQDAKDNQIAINASEEVNKTENSVTKPRDITPTYEKFQQASAVSSSSDEKTYHTVISKDTIGKKKDKNNVKLHSIEQKISKWNPLSKAHKKNRSDSFNSSDSDLSNKKHLQAKKRSALLDSTIFQLPELDPDVQGFEVEFPDQDLDNVSVQQQSLLPMRRTPPVELSDSFPKSSGSSKEQVSPVRSALTSESPTVKEIPILEYMPKDILLPQDLVAAEEIPPDRVQAQKELPLPRQPGPISKDPLHVTQELPLPKQPEPISKEPFHLTEELPLPRHPEPILREPLHSAKESSPKKPGPVAKFITPERNRETDRHNAEEPNNFTRKRSPIDEYRPSRGQLLDRSPVTERLGTKYQRQPEVARAQFSEVPDNYINDPGPGLISQYQEHHSPMPEHKRENFSPEREHYQGSPVVDYSKQSPVRMPATAQQFQGHASPVFESRRQPAEFKSPNRAEHPGIVSGNVPPEQFSHQAERQLPPGQFIDTGSSQEQNFDSGSEVRIHNEQHYLAIAQESQPAPRNQEFQSPVEHILSKVGSLEHSVQPEAQRNRSPLDSQYFDARNRLPVSMEYAGNGDSREFGIEGANRKEGTIEQLKDMVEEMMFEEANNEQLINDEGSMSQESATFESLTKFELYKPSAIKESRDSLVQPLDVPEDAADELVEQPLPPQKEAQRPPENTLQVLPQVVLQDSQAYHLSPSVSGYIATERNPQQERYAHQEAPQDYSRRLPQNVHQAMPHGVSQDIPAYRGAPPRVAQHVAQHNLRGAPQPIHQEPPQHFAQNGQPAVPYSGPHRDVRFGAQPDITRQPMQTRSPQMNIPPQRYHAAHIPMQQPRPHHPSQIPQERYHQQRPMHPQRMYPSQQPPMNQYPRNPRLPNPPQPQLQPHPQVLPPPSASSNPSMNMFIPGAPQGNKLHGGVVNRGKDRKNLYNNIRNGNFGI
ncbi:hypothetical protein HG535_0G02200 [Zygotorulaspora mrakii]|uniref:Meiotically up-regulated protein Msb1/Mug8 domain-containing protein n=1 Tax=Zygotorulaspora mrakii TaxID=42260 RepID=A0A7H9B7I5_ZYGMR|nr:uncharacterized protein HG535_0G02200 [Zygotorulaspora mrakii]QLG74336.1 hypothetical protein HG535_0G02200 [Zygotorulaspora mrakii]